MGRKKGSKNRDFDDAKRSLLERMAQAVLSNPTASWSFRELAKAAEVSVPTLRHYFVDQSHALSDVFTEYRRQGSPHLQRISSNVPQDLRTSLTKFSNEFLQGWYQGVSAIHAVGLVRGIGDTGLGPAYVNQILEPTIQALEARLAIHARDGSFPKQADFRLAAIGLIGPLFLALLHQESLFGRDCRFLDLKKFVREHIGRFIRAWTS